MVLQVLDNIYIRKNQEVDPGATNNMKTTAYIENGVEKIALTCRTPENSCTEFLPADVSSAIYWYPLYLYLDYSFLTNYSTLALKIDPLAPKKVADSFKNLKEGTPIFLKELYNPVTNSSKFTLMGEYNYAACDTMEKLGFHTWLNPSFSMEDIKFNEGLINQFWETKYLKYRQDKGISMYEPMNLLMRNEVLYGLSEEDSRMLPVFGTVYRMDFYMEKVLKERERLLHVPK